MRQRVPAPRATRYVKIRYYAYYAALLRYGRYAMMAAIVAASCRY